MKTILLLGGYGFIGSNILHYIDEHYIEQYRVIVFDRFPQHMHGHTFACVEKTMLAILQMKHLWRISLPTSIYFFRYE